MHSLIFKERDTLHSERKIWCTWVINDCVCPCRTSMQLENLPSTEFEFEFNPDLKIYAELSLSGKYFNTTCRLHLTTTAREDWEVGIKLWTCEAKLEKTYTRFSYNNQVGETLRLHDSDEKKCYLISGNYTIMCEISLSRNIEVPVQKLLAIKETQSTNDFVELFENKKDCDVALIVNGQELHAHKSKLAGRSKVFAAMFEHEMEEAKSNKVTITDIDVEVCEEMLRYIYTNKVLNLNQMASGLLAASDKYDLQNLKSMCAEELENEVSIETATKTLILSDLYRAEELKKFALDFIKNNIKAVAKTEGWKKITNHYPHLLGEICSQIIK